MTFDASTTHEGRRFQMSTIRIEKNHFLMLKFVCCTNSLKLCPLVVEKLLFDRKFAVLLPLMLVRILKVSIVSPLMH